MKGRKPKPTHLKLVTGNPGRRRVKIGPEPTAVAPLPPPELADDALTEWHRVAAELEPLGLLTVVDRAVLAAYCQAYGRWALAEQALAKMAAADPVTDGLRFRRLASGSTISALHARRRSQRFYGWGCPTGSPILADGG